MPLVADVSEDRDHEQSTGKSKAASFLPHSLNLCCSQKLQGLQFAIANAPVSAERQQYGKFIYCNYKVLFLDISLALQHFSQNLKLHKRALKM